jgi:hypothetical protein
MITGLAHRLHSPTMDRFHHPHTLAIVLTAERDRDRDRPEPGDRRGRHAPSAGEPAARPDNRPEERPGVRDGGNRHGVHPQDGLRLGVLARMLGTSMARHPHHSLCSVSGYRAAPLPMRIRVLRFRIMQR